ncbi:MAG TPA: AmmeMemoRadiSam system protein B [Candidatus Hydrogenedentes bacterium]|nr:AmmeMemoRadiSam system protein B [Candidatus Hydrogenedentota bacterium]
MGTRKPAVAGQFYPGTPNELRRTIEQCLAISGQEAAPEFVAAIVAPHAGYVYSGSTAGFAYARVRGKRPRRIVLMGCSHRYAIETASVATYDAYETPLGVLPADGAFAGILADECHSVSDEPHRYEHSLEVQLPFIQIAIGAVPVVPVLFGGPPGEWHVRFGERLAELIDPSDLIVASTDLSHYLREDQAHQVDKHTMDVLLIQDCTRFAKALAEDSCSMCGGAAVVAAMACALKRGAREWSILDYRTSAEMSGDYSRVVGYAAISMELQP